MPAVSPIFYMGSKRKLIENGLTEMFPREIRSYYEPFAGSCSVAMNVRAEKYFLSDSSPHLFELWSAYKTLSADSIIAGINERIEEYGLARERTRRCAYKDTGRIETYKAAYYSLRSHYNATKDILDFITLTFYGFSQQFRFNDRDEFNMPCGNDCFSETCERYVRSGCKFFSQENVSISLTDYSRLDAESIQPDDFVYFDPPYFGTDAVYNERGGWTESDENRLHELICRLSARGVPAAMSNVFLNRGKENTQLKNWCAEKGLSVSHLASSYAVCGRGASNADEVLICNYQAPRSVLPASRL